jgi:hypothetical protein
MFHTHEDRVNLLDSFEKYNIHNKKVAVVGSETPWIEAMLINLNNRVTTIDYNVPDCKYNDLECKDYFKYFETTTDKFDAVVCFSSIQHSGLGRYGDPLDPDGDYKVMDAIYRVLHKDGILIWGAPVGKDTLVWNAHRIYGPLRLEQVFKRFKELDWFGLSKEHLFNQQLEVHSYYQPTVVLRKAPYSKIVFICHDQASVDECLSRHTNSSILLVGPAELTSIDPRVIIVRNLPNNIEHQRKLLTFTAWYAIVKNNLFPDEDYLCILEWDMYNVPETIYHLNDVDIISFHVDDGQSFLRDINPEVLLQFLIHKNISYDNPTRPWCATSSHSIKRNIIEEFVDWYYPDCISIIRTNDIQHFSWYHERLFWCFLLHNQYTIQILHGLHHIFKNSHSSIPNTI